VNVKLIGSRDGLHTIIGRLFDDGTVAPLAEATEFYADPEHWLGAGAILASGQRNRTDIDEVPAVWPGARVLCVGLNYRLHAAEAGLDVPERPSIFGRWTASLTAGGTPMRVPIDEPGVDWEVELAVIVGKPLYRADPSTALAGVLGYAAFNDLSARRHQMHSRLWTMGKNADNSGPMSAIVTADEVGDPNAGLGLRTRVNGEIVQESTTDLMIFPVGELLAYLSETMTLNPGDVIATGTPDGVGFKRTPPRYLVAGDTVEVEVDRVGSVSTPIIGTDD
jgi:2,4-diketo-3-deoxy-L-fuconate hydrolase